MADKYEVSVTIGVRQVTPGLSSFSAADTMMIEAEGFVQLMDMLADVHDMANQLRARAGGPQDRRR